MQNNWMSGIVLHGAREGRTIGYPTVNLDTDLLPDGLTRGVYAARVRWNRQEFVGALYYGPKLVHNEERDVLEIHILDFDKTVYDEQIEFKLGKFIRGVMDFDTFPDLRKQLMEDVKAVKAVQHA